MYSEIHFLIFYFILALSCAHIMSLLMLKEQKSLWFLL